MKRVDFKKHSSIFYIGNGLIIASIVIVSSLSFLLGFFVGKQVQAPTETQATNIIPSEELGQGSQEIPLKESLQQQSATDQWSESEKNGQMVRDQQAEESLGNQPIQRQRGNLQDTGVSSTDKHRDKPQSSGTPKTIQAQEKKPKQGSSALKDTKVVQDKPKSQKSSLIRKYTVQVGAFKNPDEADALKARMSKKGYKSFVTATKTKKQETLHKVMVGEYRTRKEAEGLSIKLKSSEGLRTFVTFVMQEGVRRQQ